MSVVYLIGAGPGDPGLFTLKGKELLARCDVVVYDHLANAALLSFAREDAELIYAGKQGGDHSLPQAEISRLMVDRARQGKSVARLKGGDPYMFGRGAEEAEEILAAGLAFEVVPGVTSALAAGAYAGIPLTHRSHASSVCFVTGHEDPTKPESALNWEALAKAAGTLVFYMGVKNLPEIARRLTAAGLPGATPAALIRWGTTPEHKSLVSTLENLPRDAEKHGFTAPCVIIIGSVVTLRDTLNWFEKKPLLGKNIVVTRSRGQSSAMSAMLRDMGAQVVEFPTISIRPLEDYGPVREAIRALRDYDWVLFTSANGVSFFWRELTGLGLDSRALAGTKVAAIGPGTAQALEGHGIRADFIPQTFVAEDMLAGLLALGVAGKRMLIPRAEKARDMLPEGLEKAGAHVRVLPVYAACPCAEGKEEVLRLLETGALHAVTFASSSTVTNFFAAVPAAALRGRATPRFACIGPVTAQTLHDAGFPCHIQPERHTIEDLVAALAKAL